MKEVAEEYVSETSGQESEDVKQRTVRSIVAKFMMPINKCSINMVLLSDLEDQESANSQKSFTFGAIKRAYATRPDILALLNLYRFAALHYGKATPESPIVPMFMGYKDTPSWPPSEEYAKTMLMIYHPWRENFESIKSDPDMTYTELFESFMWNTTFPRASQCSWSACV